MSEKRKYVECVQVGEAEKKMSKKSEFVKVTFNRFQSLKGQHTIRRSPTFKACGYDWSLCVECDSRVSFSVRSINTNHMPHALVHLHSKHFYSNGSGSGVIQFTHYPKWTDLIRHCLEEDGSLVLDVEFQVSEGSERTWYPKPLEKQPFLMELYQNMSTAANCNFVNFDADVIFIVEDEQIYSHKLVLRFLAKELFELSKEHNAEPIPIPNMKTGTFRKVLEYVYTVDVPKIETVPEAVELLIAADKCGCISLKLYIESVITEKFIAIENAAELLSVGDSHSCALLKEAAMNLIATHLEDVMKTNGWSHVKESLLLVTEILQVSYRKFGPNASKSISNDSISTMDITALREALEEANLEVDGSREILVQRLKELTEK